MPRALPILTVAALAVVLAGCAAGEPAPTGTPTDGSTPVARECAAAGPLSDAVKVTGELGAQPTVEFAAPLAPDATQRTVVVEGDGEATPYPAVVSVDYSFYDGTTGKLVEATKYAEGEQAVFVLDDSKLLRGLLKTVECTPVGSRVVGVVPASDGFGDAGLAQFGISGGDSLVFVVDVVDAARRATGEAQTAPSGLPAVTLASDGTPAIAIPDGYQAPTETESATLIRGAGREVQASDTVYIQYQGVNAATGKIFDQTWDKAPYSGSASGFITGFTNALVGQTVGSQFIVVIPPKDGYGEASDSNTNTLAGQTLVFVVDVLAAVPAA